MILGATCVFFSALLRLNTLYQPNSLDVLCWVSFHYLIIRYFNTESPKWLFATAFIFALGFLNKYNIVFLIIGIFPAILLTSQRRMFLKKELYLAVLVGLVLISPNLWWQYQNDFPVVHHMQQLKVTQLVHVDRAGFLWSQILFFAGSLHVLLIGVSALLFYRPFRKHQAFFFALIFTLIVFIYFRAKDYYAIGLYPIYLSFGAVFLAEVLKEGWRKYLKPVVLLIPLLIFVPIFQIAFPNRSPEYVIEHSETYQKYGMLRWEDGKDHALPQDFADMLGWKELAGKVDSVYSGLPNADRTLILCDNYGQAGAINYYSKLDLRAVSFNADYIDWFNLERPYFNLIRVKESDENSREFEETSPYFEQAFLADSISNPYAREYKTMIFAFTGAKLDINQRIKQEMESVKSDR